MENRKIKGERKGVEDRIVRNQKIMGDQKVWDAEKLCENWKLEGEKSCGVSINWEIMKWCEDQIVGN